MKAEAAPWRQRIVGHDELDPAELIANPRNWRGHPRHQHDALSGLLGEVGWVQQVIVNRTTGRLVDGHLRVELAAGRGERVPVVYVELTEDEEALVLVSLDPLAGLATTDAERLGLSSKAWSPRPPTCARCSPTSPVASASTRPGAA
jgi:hypothetical protein